jgi:hypothetical protein
MMMIDDDLAPENVEGDTLALNRWAGFDRAARLAAIPAGERGEGR